MTIAISAMMDCIFLRDMPSNCLLLIILFAILGTTLHYKYIFPKGNFITFLKLFQFDFIPVLVLAPVNGVFSRIEYH